MKRNSVKIELSLKNENEPKLKISLQITAGLSDDNTPDTLNELTKSPKISFPALKQAERKLKEQIEGIFEKSRAVDCDIFECVETLRRKEYKNYEQKRNTLLQEIKPEIKVEFKTVR